MALREGTVTADDEAGRDSAAPSRARPVDMVHLARQTLGDAELEREILSMFLQQIRSVRARIDGAGREERRQLAHGLVGAGRGVGAFRLATCAADIETGSDDPARIEQLKLLIDDTCDFLSGMDCMDEMNARGPRS